MLTDDEIETFELMIELARLSARARRNPALVEWFWQNTTPGQVAEFKRLHEAHAEVRRACAVAYRDEERLIASDRRALLRSVPMPPDAAPSPPAAGAHHGSSDSE